MPCVKQNFFIIGSSMKPRFLVSDDPAAHIIMPTNSSDRSKLIEEHLIALKQKHAADE